MGVTDEEPDVSPVVNHHDDAGDARELARAEPGAVSYCDTRLRRIERLASVPRESVAVLLNILREEMRLALDVPVDPCAIRTYPDPCQKAVRPVLAENASRIARRNEVANDRHTAEHGRAHQRRGPPRNGQGCLALTSSRRAPPAPRPARRRPVYTDGSSKRAPDIDREGCLNIEAKNGQNDRFLSRFSATEGQHGLSDASKALFRVHPPVGPATTLLSRELLFP